jgi:hypothetical protein
MSAPTLPERLDRIEDELAGLESMVDSRTRTLWREVEKLQAGGKDLQELLQVQAPHNPTDSAKGARR